MSDIKTKEQKSAEKAAKAEAKKAARANKPKPQRVSFSETYDKVQGNIPALFLTCLASLIIMFMVCAGVFFANMKGAEQVLVPNVVGKTLEDGIIEMQIKELYPKVSLRYSDEVKEKGIILEQSPSAGAIVKGYSTVTLVVSRGDEEEEIPDLVGKLYDSVKDSINSAEDSKKKALISYSLPSYISNNAPAGTIIAQTPAAGTKVCEKTLVSYIVSKGMEKETVEVPNVKGMGIDELVSVIGNTNLIFDVTYHKPEASEIAGTVTSQSVSENQSKEKYTRINVDMALDDTLENTVVTGVFTQKLSDYPVPVMMSLEGVTPEGKTFDIAKIRHIGGTVTIPYAIPKGTTLVFSVLGDVKTKTVIG